MCLFAGSWRGRLLAAFAALVLGGTDAVAAQPSVIDLGYVTNAVSDSISVVDTHTNTIADEILLDGTLRDADVGPGGRFVWAATRAPDRVVVVDLKGQRIAAEIDGVGAQPEAIIIAPDGKTAYVTSFGDDLVTMIDTRTRRVLATVAVQHGPNDLASTPDSRFVFVTNHFSDSVSVIDARQRAVAATVPVGEFPTGIAMAPDGRTAYVVNFVSSTVSVIDTAARGVRATVPIDVLGPESLPSSIAVTPDGRFALLTNFGSGSAITIDTARDAVTSVIEGVGSYPADVAVSPRGDCAYVSSFEVHGDRSAAPGTVSVIDIHGQTMAVPPIAVAELPVSVRFPHACTGDCGGDGSVTVSELVAGVGLLLSGNAPSSCAALDVNADQAVSVDELVAAVERLLNGCTPEPVTTLALSPRAAAARAARAREREGRCGNTVCAQGEVCVRDLLCHLRGCTPSDTCCRPDDRECGTPLP